MSNERKLQQVIYRINEDGSKNFAEIQNNIFVQFKIHIKHFVTYMYITTLTCILKHLE